MKMKAFQNVDDYIDAFPEEVRKKLNQMRSTITKAAPDATEKISYGMPAYDFMGALVYFAAFRKHIGFYATPTGNAAFVKELAGYKTGNGSIQFPIDAPLPLKLIVRITKFRIAENIERTTRKSAAKKPFSVVGQPAQRALSAAGIKTVKDLSQYPEEEILALHGIGKTAVRTLSVLLGDAGLHFRPKS
jgi:uncharacterized protein YdhG (YjbR/CyaY superfamily)